MEKPLHLRYFEGLRKNPANQNEILQTAINQAEQLLITQGVQGLDYTDPPNPTNYGEIVHARRLALGLSQRRLAGIARVSHGYIALLEIGQVPNPGALKIWALEDALGYERGQMTEMLLKDNT